jgi:hypothetical protein
MLFLCVRELGATKSLSDVSVSAGGQMERVFSFMSVARGRYNGARSNRLPLPGGEPAPHGAAAASGWGHMPKLFWIGLAVFVLGQAPLLLMLAAVQLSLWPDPHPNPIGPGLLSFVTFWPGLVLMLLGFLRRGRTA